MLDKAESAASMISEDPGRTRNNMLEAGRAAAPAGGTAKNRPRKRLGCILAGLVLLALWIGGGWALWLGGKNAPDRNDDEATSFEIIPKARDSSVAGDNGDE